MNDVLQSIIVGLVTARVHNEPLVTAVVNRSYKPANDNNALL